MKAKWSPFKPFDPEKSAAYAPFLARAKNHPEARVHFNQFGQVLCGETGGLLPWLPEEISEVPDTKAKEGSEPADS